MNNVLIFELFEFLNENCVKMIRASNDNKERILCMILLYVETVMFL